MQSICAKVPIEKGEFFRKKLSEAKVNNTKLMIKRIDGFLFIPLSSTPETINSSQPQNPWVAEIKFLKMDFDKYPDKISSYKSLLHLPPESYKKLPTSYDIIGDIAVIKIPESLINNTKMIGDAIIKIHKNINTVLWDMGVKGEHRVRDFKIIAGKKNTITVHKQYGIRLKLDIAKVYFSPRLGREHYRISKLVKPREIVLDMFSGVGPFSIMISKYSKAFQIYSIDWNKEAIEYLIKNVDLNNVNNIFPLEGDVGEIIDKIPQVDRIIMNLPKGAYSYLDIAISKLKPSGVLHYHEMLDVHEVDERLSDLEANFIKEGYRLKKTVTNDLGSYSATINHYCLDLYLRKK